MTINQRLSQYIVTEKVSAPEFYKKIGVDKNVWSGWINSGRAISVTKLQEIVANAPTLNARWLLTGEGEMLNCIISGKDTKILIQNVNNKGGNGNTLSEDEKSRWIKDLQKIIQLQEENMLLKESMEKKNVDMSFVGN